MGDGTLVFPECEGIFSCAPRRHNPAQKKRKKTNKKNCRKAQFSFHARTTIVPVILFIIINVSLLTFHPEGSDGLGSSVSFVHSTKSSSSAK